MDGHFDETVNKRGVCVMGVMGAAGTGRLCAPHKKAGPYPIAFRTFLQPLALHSAYQMKRHPHIFSPISDVLFIVAMIK